MIRNTKELIRVLKIWVGGFSLLTGGLFVYLVSRGLHQMQKYHRKFNKDTVEEVTGKITDVILPGEGHNISRGVILEIKFGEEIKEVHLGPSWYIERQFRHFKIGEEITVVGSKIHYRNREIIVAENLQRGNSIFRLRDEEGIPYWEAKIT